MLEGPRGVETAAVHRILRDDRHLDVVLIGCGDAKARVFADWSMRDDPARSFCYVLQYSGIGTSLPQSQQQF
jgi:hypothetical protein